MTDTNNDADVFYIVARGVARGASRVFFFYAPQPAGPSRPPAGGLGPLSALYYEERSQKNNDAGVFYIVVASVVVAHRESIFFLTRTRAQPARGLPPIGAAQRTVL